MRVIRFAALILFMCVGITFSEKSAGLKFIWHKGPLGEALREISKTYTDRTGVSVSVDLVEWDAWHEKILEDFQSRSFQYDLNIFDSQSMSEFASAGHVELLNPFLEKSKSLKTSDFDPAALRTYGEFPENSGDYYALPINQDTMGLAYRKDLFEDPKEKEAFRGRYNRELAVPETYSELRDIAEFFTRPDQNLYGIALFGSSEYDAVTSSFNNVLWSFGGELWDPATRKVEGVLNSAASVAALEFYKELFAFAPPNAHNFFYNEVTSALHAGHAAMAINWYYFFGADSDPKVNSIANKIGFAALPGVKNSDGKLVQFHMIGGQGISISRYSKQKQEAWKFLEWFMSKETQWLWVRSGAQTGRIDILQSPEYHQVNAFNKSFSTSMTRVKDYWHLVEYPQLLRVYQKYTHEAISGKMSPADALRNTAREQQAMLDSSASLTR